MTATAFEKSIFALQQNDQRVWSLVVTLFGDMAQGTDDRISATQLAKITGILGIKPQATRVALHRLRKDNWLISEKSGRNSHYALSDFGRTQSMAASARIYGSFAPVADDWHVLVLPSKPLAARKTMAAGLVENGYVLLNNSVLLGHGVAPKQNQYLVLAGGDALVPDWVSALVFPKALNVELQNFTKTLQRVSKNLPADFTALETVALRVLIVHHWRKLVLRAPKMPLEIQPENWPEPECRALVRDILQQLKRPDIKTL